MPSHFSSTAPRGQAPDLQGFWGRTQPIVRGSNANQVDKVGVTGKECGQHASLELHEVASSLSASGRKSDEDRNPRFSRFQCPNPISEGLNLLLSFWGRTEVTLHDLLFKTVSVFLTRPLGSSGLK